MPRPKVIRGDHKDHKVTVRLDDATYESLKEAREQGAITNLSEVIRSMIRQKLWEKRISEEMESDQRLADIGDEELRSAVNIVLGNFDTAEQREFVKLDGYLEGLFSALGGIIKRAVTELERREQRKKISGT